MTFSVGDKVLIKPSSEYYGKNHANPADVEGVVVAGYDDPFLYHVKWSTGYHNHYTCSDLMPARKPASWFVGTWPVTPETGELVYSILKAHGIDWRSGGVMAVPTQATHLCVDASGVLLWGTSKIPDRDIKELLEL